jgi:hypothetical protein
MKLSSHKLSRDSRPELSMTSMIDVVFLLLIFFMTTSSFLKTERDLDSGIQVERRSGERRGDFEPAIVDVVRRRAGLSSGSADASFSASGNSRGPASVREQSGRSVCACQR